MDKHTAGTKVKKEVPPAFQAGLVAIGSLVDEVLASQQQSGKAITNALHHFLDGVKTLSNEAVQFGLEEKAKSTEDKGIKARCSELKAVFTASRHGFAVQESGYVETVKAARAKLKELGIYANGNTRKDQALIEAERKHRFMKKAVVDFMDQGMEPAEAGELAKEAYEKEQRTREGVPQMEINDAAYTVVEDLLKQGYDHKAIRRIFTAARELLDNMGQAASQPAQ